MTLLSRQPRHRGSATLWLIAAAALALLIIIGLLAASRPSRLRSQGYTAPSPLATADDKAKVKVSNKDTTNCKVTSNKDKDAKSPAINCGDDCEQEYTVGDEITLYVHPADGYEFDKWESVSNCQGCEGSGSSNCMVLVHTDGNECKVLCKKSSSSPTPSASR
ncbi:MAG: hypothetical protein HY372_01500 [Candidatus Andersenbacteria bacterium]|nr:hypothetical protein [Candidatus Andersenbacteria bacterium]